VVGERSTRGRTMTHTERTGEKEWKHERKRRMQDLR
jgi:hypothetical protein